MNLYTSVDDDTQSFYNRTTLVRAVPYLVHDKFGQQKPLKNNETRKQTFRRINAFAVATTPLVEGVNPQSTDMTHTDVTATLSEYGAFTTVSSLAKLVGRDKLLTEAAEALGEQAGQSIDQIYRDILVAGTSVFCHEGSDVYGTTRTSIDGLITAVGFRLAQRYLKGQNAKFMVPAIKASTGVGTGPIRQAFWAIMHTDVEYDAEVLEGFKSTSEYGSNSNVMESEIGAYKNIRIVTSSQAKVFADAGADKGTGHKSTTGVKEDVYATLVFGKDAYGIVPLSGHSLQNIVKGAEHGGPLNRYVTSGWVAITTAVILNDAFMTRIETGATA